MGAGVLLCADRTVFISRARLLELQRFAPSVLICNLLRERYLVAKRSGKWGLVVAVVCIAGIALMGMRVDLARTLFARSADAKTTGSGSTPPARSDTAKQDIRSEERRVGEECR